MPPTVELSDALVLRLQPVRDADLIVTLLDPHHGRVDAYARSARKSSRRFGGRLELFLRGTAKISYGRGDLPQLSGFEHIADLAPKSVDWPLLCLISSVAELALVASQPAHADLQLHAWACHVLRACDGLAASRLRLASLVIDLGFLAAVGSLPDLQHCGSCDASTVDGAVWRDVGEPWMCSSCAQDPVQTVNGRSLATLLALLRDPSGLHDAFFPRSVGRNLRAHVDKLLAEVLPRPLRTRAQLQQALSGISG